MGGSQSIAFPIMILNATVAEAIAEITARLREALPTSKTVDDAVLQVVRTVFKETSAIRFEGNNYADAWVTEAERRGLPNYRHSPDALAQLVSDQSRALFTSLGILSTEELESRYHVRLERYVKDKLIELHTLEQMADTMILPAAYSYAGMLAEGASRAKSAGITAVPQVDAANELGRSIERLRSARAALHGVIEQAEGMHDALEKQATFLSTEGADRMAEVRAACDALELAVGDEWWPLPKYREILFPV